MTDLRDIRVLSTRQRYRHKKRGTTYQKVCDAELQVAVGMVFEGDLLRIYQAEDGGNFYAREVMEFDDGRFEQIEDASTPAAEHGADTEALVQERDVARAQRDVLVEAVRAHRRALLSKGSVGENDVELYDALDEVLRRGAN